MSSVLDSSGVEIRIVDPSKGTRHLFAKRCFAEGEAVATELPVASCQLPWNQECKYAACNLCLRPLETAEANARRLALKPDLSLPQPGCCTTRTVEHVVCPACQVKYCSDACRLQAWKLHHQVLCAMDSKPVRPLRQLLDEWRTTNFPPETTSVELVVRILAWIIQAGGKAVAVLEDLAAGSSGSMTEEEQEGILSRVLGDQYVQRLGTLRQMTTLLFKGHPCVYLWLTQEGFQSLMALVVRRGQLIGTSALSVWVKNCDALDLPDAERASLDDFINRLYDDIEKESGAFLNNEGVGLFPLESLCSHSCVPNVESSFLHNNHVLSLVALRDIEAGEEITVSYLDECSLSRSRHSRARLLRENHMLSCSCTRCQAEADQPDVTSDEEMDDEGN